MSAILTDRDMNTKPKGEDLWLTEPGPRGAGRLVGRITPAGDRSFYFRYTTASGARDALQLGRYDQKGVSGLTLAQAREKAGELSRLYQSGIKDLRKHFAQMEADRLAAEELERQRIEDERRQREAQAAAEALALARRKTVRQMFDQWRQTLRPLTRADGRRIGRKDGGLYVFEQFERHVFPSIGNIPIEEVRKSDLLAILEAKTAEGKARTANVLLADLKQFFGYAAEHEVIPVNPLASVRKAKVGGADVARERALQPEEIKMLVRAAPASGLNLRAQAAVWLILATGARIGEAMGAVWADTLPPHPLQRKARMEELLAVAEADGVKLGVIDMEACTWHILSTKNQRDHTIHLSRFALAQIEKLSQLREALKGSTDHTPWLFPATDNSRPVCVKSLGKQLSDRQRPPERRMKNRSKHTDGLSLPGGKWTAHDLRRTTGSRMADLGVSADTINECLNHVTTDRMAKVYIRSRRRDDQIRAFDAMGRYLERLTAEASSNVVVLRRA